MLKEKIRKRSNLIVGFSEELGKEVEIEKDFVKPILKGEDVSKYAPLENSYWVIFPYNLRGGKAVSLSENEIKERFPKGFDYLKRNEKTLRAREKGRFDNSKEWFLLSRKQGLNDVEQERIVTPEISFGTNMTFDTGRLYHNTKVYSFVKNKNFKEDYKIYLSILNSSLMWFFLKNTGYELRGGYFTFKTKYLEPFPLPKISSSDQKHFIEKADLMLEMNKELYEKKNKFLNRIKELGADKISKKLDSFFSLSFSEFLEELDKQKVKLNLRQKEEWEDYFEERKKELSELKAKIDETDREIDQEVYKLYDLTQEEIKIVEGN